jgi:hypothetical protein
MVVTGKTGSQPVFSAATMEAKRRVAGGARRAPPVNALFYVLD